MDVSYIWISRSLHCAKKHWPELLKMGIRPFVNSTDIQELKRYQIRFNLTNAENIELFVLTVENKVNEISNKMDDHFNRFFSEHSCMNTRQQPVQHCHYGLTYEQALTNTTYKLQEALSAILINDINRTDLGDDAMLTRCFKLHAGVIRIMLPYYNNDLAELSGMYQIDPAMKIEKKTMDSRYIQKAAGILNEVLYNEPSEVANSSDWVDAWVSVCNEYIQGERQGIEAEYGADITTTRNIHGKLTDIINYQFGFEIWQVIYLYDLLTYALACSFNEKISCRHSYVNHDIIKLNHYLNVIRTGSIYKRMDNISIADNKDEIRLFAIARNESLRLPFFLKYYTDLGVDRFFLIDNGSTDNTCEIALEKNNVHVFVIEEGYRNHWYWMEYFLHEYGANHWCMVVDIDELFHFPYSESLRLNDLTTYLDAHNYTAIKSVLLDMYSDKPIANTVYRPNDNPIDVCSYFETNYITLGGVYFDHKLGAKFHTRCQFGGVRTRIFGHLGFCLTKVSLFRYEVNTYLVQGMHSINGAWIADIEGAVLHTKFFHDFIEEAQEESVRGEHFNNGHEYRIYNELLTRKTDLAIKRNKSYRFSGTNQLIELGIMKNSCKYERFVKQKKIDHKELS